MISAGAKSYDGLRSPRQQPDTRWVSYAVTARRIASKDAHFTGSAGAPCTPSLKVLSGGRAVAPEAGPGFRRSSGTAFGPPAKGFKRTTGGCDDAGFEIVSALRR
jgi:hypothetical protein